MAKQLSPVPKLQFIDELGAPYAGGFLYTYVAGSDTPLATYSNAAGTANTNPVELDDAGSATVYLGTGSYKFVLKDVNLVTVFTQDNVSNAYIDAATAQTLSNKTLDDSTVLAIKDSNLTIEKAADATAVVKFSASLVTTGTVRTITVPDASLTLAGQNFANVFTKRQQWGQGASVASANDLTLGADGNSFLISGTTQINAITTSGWANGSIITLTFGGNITVKYNTAGSAGTAKILLQGATDFNAGNPDILVLKLEDDGTPLWVEIARAVHSTTANGLVRTDIVTLTNAQIKALPTTAVDLIAAPGSNRMIQFLQALLVLDVSAGKYTNVDAAALMRIRSKSGLVSLSNDSDHTLLDTANDKYIVTLTAKVDGVGYTRDKRDNRAVQLFCTNASAGDFTGGDTANTLKVYITYLIQVLP